MNIPKLEKIQYDPELKKAMSEIEAVCQKYDCAGFFHLTSKTHGEFRFILPEWIWIKIEDSVFHFRTRTTHPEEAKNTIGFVFDLADMANNLIGITNHLKKKIKEKMSVTHKKFNKFTPYIPES